MAEFKTFEDLKAWQACRDLRRFVSRSIIPLFPRSEQFRLTDQLYRCSRSTTANIAEGYGRYHYLDKVKFCSQSRGSVYEVLDHALTANDDAYIDESVVAETRKLVESAAKLINGYIRYLRKEKQNSDNSDPE
jgi:four helix bundle protein